jgi:Protease inhibitor Inh
MRNRLALIALVPMLGATFAIAQQPRTPPAPPAAAPAQPSPAGSDAFKAVLGKWEISNADRDRVCIVTFRADQSGSVFKIDMDKTCQPQMPELKDVVAWTIGGLDLVRLMDAKGRPVMEFSEVESGTYEADRPGEGLFFMQSAAVAANAVGIAADQMAGDWNVVRSSGKSICTITLTNTAAGADSFALKLKPGCDAAVTRFGPAAWYMDRGELVLRSRGNQFWRFEANDPTNWQRVPEGRDPISLVRQ